jgi:hypothetical protein
MGLWLSPKKVQDFKEKRAKVGFGGGSRRGAEQTYLGSRAGGSEIRLPLRINLTQVSPAPEGPGRCLGLKRQLPP